MNTGTQGTTIRCPTPASISHVAVPRIQATAPIATYATTSRTRRSSSPARMPLSIASPTTCQPATGAAAETAARARMIAIRPWRPSV